MEEEKGNYDSQEAQKEDVKAALADELKKVRSTLRGNLVPEARKLVTDNDEFSSLLRAPLIWILACGTWQDHFAYASLAAALQKSGYRVKVFGVGFFANIFSRLGIAFEPIDRRVPQHPLNFKAKEFIQKACVESHLDGPNKEEDFLLEMALLRHEFVARNIVKSVLQGRKEGWLQDAQVHEKRFNDFFFRSDCSNEFRRYTIERYVEIIHWRAHERRVSVENYIPIRKAHQDAFRNYVRQKAQEEGFDTLDVVDCLRNEFSRRLSNQINKAAAENKDPTDVIIAEIVDYLLWHSGESPREWWERWMVKLPAWRQMIPSVKTEFSLVQITMHNMLLNMSNLEPQERPQLVLYRVELASVALMLEAQYQLQVAMAWPWQLPTNRPSHMLLYKYLVAEEEREPLPFTPVRDMGPLAFSELLRSSRQISGQTTLRLKDDVLPLEIRSNPVDLHGLRECCTGLWTSGTDLMLLQRDDAALFGTRGERDAAVSFLADSSDPPICLGWGKRWCPTGPENLVLLITRTLRRLGRRGIFLTGFSTAGIHHLQGLAAAETGPSQAEYKTLLEYAQRQILFLKAAPHSWLFPHCACVVHDGGHGTVQVALRAGVPQIITPAFKREKEFCEAGRFIQQLGCGKETPMLEAVTPQQLAESVRFVLTDPSVKAKAAEIAKSLHKDPGAFGAVALVANILRPAPPQEVPRQVAPWADGVYGLYYQGKKIFANIFSGFRVLNPDGAQIGWMKCGSFRHETTQGLLPGHAAYTIMAFWGDASHVGYGTASSDGKRITWDDGNWHEWESEIPSAQKQDEEGFSALGFLGGLVSTIAKPLDFGSGTSS